MTGTTNRVATWNVLAPVSGVIIPLEQISDPVVAWRRHGVGAAIDSLDGAVVAPLAGTVAWTIEPGEFEIRVGVSSADIGMKRAIQIPPGN